MQAVQMKEHLKGISSSLVLIDDVHLYVLKAEGPHAQHRRSDAMSASVKKVWTGCKAVNSMLAIKAGQIAKNA